MVFRFHTKCFPKKITMWKLQLDHYAFGLFFSSVLFIYILFCVFIYIKIKWHNGPFCRIFFTAAVAAFATLWYYCFGVFFLLNGIVRHLFFFLLFCEVLVCLLSYSSQAFVYFIIVSMFKCIFSIPKQVRTHAHAHNTIFGGHCQRF